MNFKYGDSNDKENNLLDLYNSKLKNEKDEIILEGGKFKIYCYPDTLKFKFVLCDVEINNNTATSHKIGFKDKAKTSKIKYKYYTGINIDDYGAKIESLKEELEYKDECIRRLKELFKEQSEKLKENKKSEGLFQWLINKFKGN